MATTQPGYVYLVQMEGHQVFKIGRCNSVPRRMTEIGLQMPYPYHMIFARRVSDAIGTEASLHRTFKDQRTNGEWFNLLDIQVEGLKIILLITQADELLDRLVEALGNRYRGKGPEVERHANLIIRASRRSMRRQTQLYKLRDRFLETPPISETEVVQ